MGVVKRLAILMCLVLGIGISSGCALFTRYVYVDSTFPVLSKPARPVLVAVSADDLVGLDSEVRYKVLKMVLELRDYAERLEWVVDEYNKFAALENAKSASSE